MNIYTTNNVIETLQEDINILSARVDKLCIVCTILGIATVLQGIALIWR